MKVFVSSLISGMEAEREAARQAVRLFQHEPIMAKDLGARPSSPQVACLSALRESDLVVLILGDRYGAKQTVRYRGFGREHERGAPVTLSPPHLVRAALAMDADRIVEDLLVLLRQRWKEPGGMSW